MIKRFPFLFQQTKISEWLLLAVFALFPFQKRFKHLFSSLLKNSTPEHLEFPEYFSHHLNLYLTDFIVLFIAVLCLFQRTGQWKSFFLRGPAKYLSLLLAVMVGSLLHSIASGYLLQYLKLLEFLSVLLLFCSTVEVCSRGFFQKLCWTVFSISLIQCCIGTTQYFTQANVGFKGMGEPTLFFPLPMTASYRWIIDPLLGIHPNTHLLHRCTGTFTHPNILGGFLFFSLLFTYFLFWKESKTWRSRALQIALFFQMFTLTITYSRSAIIATFFCTLLWFGLNYAKLRTDPRLKNLLLTIFLSGATCFALFYPQILSRGGLINQNAVNQGADQERVVYHHLALDMFKQSPLLGIGNNNFQLHTQTHAPKEYPEELHSKVHNIYLLILSELGLIGLIVFLFFIGSVLAKSQILDPASITLLSLFLGFLFIGGCDFYLLGIQHGKILFFTTAALLWAQPKTELQPVLHHFR